ncbi:30S ribosomal protein S6 [Anaerorhabdus sp.]|uniref:30S ribosomal protein S6 n=1 Tax=Anaerorhabdus sp. TaxID=1872524 RepID=UPI002FCCA716
MRKYEVMYIVNASLEDAKRQEVIESMHGIITNGGGKIVNVDEWGVKEFAYRIEDMTKGYYMVVTFEADNETVKEFERLMRINASIVRFMIVKQDEN